jgi:hypothetical protein
VQASAQRRGAPRASGWLGVPEGLGQHGLAGEGAARGVEDRVPLGQERIREQVVLGRRLGAEDVAKGLVDE